MTSRPSKAAPLLFILLGVLALAFILAARGARDKPIAVSSTQPVRQDLSSWISSNGKVEPIEPHIIQSQLTTFVETVSVKEGQMVRLGQTLLSLDATDLRIELAHMREQVVSAEDERKVALGGGPPEEIVQLRSDLAKIDSEIDRIRREGDSLQRLYTKQAATRQEVDQNKIALERAEAEKRLIEEKKDALIQRSKIQAERAGLRVDEARSSLRSLEEKLKASQIVAPVTGTLYSLPVRARMFVHTGDSLAEMADLTRIRVRVFVDEPELGSLKEGDSVEIVWDALPNRMWTGRVEQLPKTIVARGSRNVGEVLCSVSTEKGELLPNTNVSARIRTNQRENSLTIPRSAVLAEGNRRYVFVIDRGLLRKKEVTLGISNATDQEIVDGIAENDVIALPSGSELQEGMAVIAAQQK
jgi:HlyD family secretion protein